MQVGVNQVLLSCNKQIAILTAANQMPPFRIFFLFHLTKFNFIRSTPGRLSLIVRLSLEQTKRRHLVSSRCRRK